MNKKLAKCAATAALSIGAASPALAGSVTRPGDTIGLAVGSPLPRGLYLANTTTYECRSTDPKHACLLVDVPVLVWSTPWKVLGAHFQPSTGPLVPLKISVGSTDVKGMFNPFGAAQLIWDLGDGFGFSYMLGGYLKTRNKLAFSSSSLNQRFGLSYTADGWNLTANAIVGIQFDKVTKRPQISPCPVTAAHPKNGCNPHFLNIDMTATKKFGKWELGAVGVYSADLNRPIPEYKKQRQLQLGGLVGYQLGPVVTQLYVTRNVYQDNYGAPLTSGTLRLVIPLAAGPSAGDSR